MSMALKPVTDSPSVSAAESGSLGHFGLNHNLKKNLKFSSSVSKKSSYYYLLVLLLYLCPKVYWEVVKYCIYRFRLKPKVTKSHVWNLPLIVVVPVFIIQICC